MDTHENKPRQAYLEKHVTDGVHVTILRRGKNREAFLSAPLGTEEAAAGLVHDLGVTPVFQRVFGHADYAVAGRHAAGKRAGVTWPVHQIILAGDEGVSGGTEIRAVAGTDIVPLTIGGAACGVVFGDGPARFVRLGGLTPPNTRETTLEQARKTFEIMKAAVEEAGLSFSNVIRTWFYNDRILDWYDDFNAARNTFFDANGVYDGIVPASTAVGGKNKTGAALTGDLLALASAGCRDVTVSAVTSPLQPPALDYGSSFSRAVKVAFADHSRLYVSGTASIRPDGATAYPDDTGKQIQLTFETVRAILESQGMGWIDVNRAIAYVKEPEGFRALNACRQTGDLPDLPMIQVQSDICRSDLLFELELDAIGADAS